MWPSASPLCKSPAADSGLRSRYNIFSRLILSLWVDIQVSFNYESCVSRIAGSPLFRNGRVAPLLAVVRVLGPKLFLEPFSQPHSHRLEFFPSRGSQRHRCVGYPAGFQSNLIAPPGSAGITQRRDSSPPSSCGIIETRIQACEKLAPNPSCAM
jgi:hypothetical protein